MGQLNFDYNYFLDQREAGGGEYQVSNGILTFFPWTLYESLSISVVNMRLNGAGGANGSYSLHFGLYSLNVSTLSLANSLSASRANPSGVWISATGLSAAQNVTPGNWWWGVFALSHSSSGMSMYGQASITPANAFPGAFLQGRMTVATNAVPASYATSDLDITGLDAMSMPLILVSA